MGRDGRTNPRAAAREAREEHEKEMRFSSDLLKLLNDFYGYGYLVRWEQDDIRSVRGAIDSIHQEKIKQDRIRREKETYEKRRNGVLRVRSWPVRCYLRERWYKDLDGTDPFESGLSGKKKSLSLSAYKLMLGSRTVPKRERYRY